MLAIPRGDTSSLPVVLSAEIDFMISFYIYHSEFIKSSAVKIALNLSTGLVQVIAVANGFGLNGLIYGQLIASFVVVLVLMWSAKIWPFSSKSEQFLIG